MFLYLINKIMKSN